MRQIVMLVMPLLIASGCRWRDARPSGYRVPPGFSIEAAGPASRLGALAGFTFDSRGRPVVFKERGFATLLLDNNRDGLFETEKILTTKVNAVRGIWFDGRVLYLLGHGPENQYGLYRLEDRDGDDDMDGLEQLSQFDPPAPGLHDIRRGPDGLLTLLQGGKWLRWNEDHHTLTVLATGFANPRSHAYHRNGEAFVLDDDAGIMHAITGGDYSPPAYHFDALPPMREAIGAGLEFYQHHLFPEAFRDALFQTEGKPGRIVARRVVRNGATFRLDETAIAEFVTGDPHTVTGIKVGPDGLVYFTTAGPGNHGGGLYRIRYAPSVRERWERWRAPPPADLAIVRQPQPLSAWGHAALQRERELLESRWGEDLEGLARKAGASPEDRAQAILILRRFGPKPKPALIKALVADAEPLVRAAAMYALPPAGLADPDPLVRRRAAEALEGSFDPNVYPLLGDADRFVRSAARLALERMPREEWKQRVLDEPNPRIALEGMLALIHAGGEREEVLEKLLPILADPSVRLNALRLFTLASAGVKDAALRKRAAEVLLALFPAQDEPQNRELAPALAWCGGGEAIQKLLEAIANSANNRPLQLHYAQSLRSIKDGWRTDQKAAMLAWFGKAAEWPGNASFTKSLSQLFQAILNSGAFSRQESRIARQRFPNLAGTTAAPGNLLTADEMFDLQTSNPPPAATPGKGREIFEKQCASCHRLGTLGNEAGPDLTELAKRLDKTAILEAILWPSREVPERYASVAIELADGSEIEGLVVREDDKVLLLKTATEPRPVSILKSRVKSRQASEKSIMPEGLLDGYDNGAIASLMAFLQ